MSKKTGVFRGISSIFAFLCALSLVLGGILEGFAATIDTALGTQSEVFVSESTADDPLYDKFKPSDDVLNEDGSGNSHALIQKAIDLNRRQASEGAVLLKNSREKDQGLPLKAGSAVSLFGIRSHVTIIGSSFGVKAWGPYISLEQALSQNRTDFAHTMSYAMNNNWQTGEVTRGATLSDWTGDEFDFDGAGFSVNPTMSEIYKSINQQEAYLLCENEGASNSYDPKEPSLDEIAAVNPNYKDSFADYSDAAIVVISRPTSESTDFLPGGVAEGTDMTEPLAISPDEWDAINLAKEASDNVIVLLNTSSAVEIKDLKEDEEIDSILWIGNPGCYGLLGIADILSGKVSPSGGLFDIFPTYNMSAPAMQNMGLFQYANAEDVITRGGGAFGGTVGTYLMEAEGIYVGYRYYDSVLGQGNADSKAGAYASDQGWNYDDEVVYGFGYGDSYTTFDRVIEGDPIFEAEGDLENAYATFNVKVTNTGDTAGKTSVQIYGQAPYTAGGIEKSAVQLLNFEKSEVLQPGESASIPVKVDLQYIASYDASYDNGDGTFGTYILDPGTYFFAVGNGAHEAQNSMMLKAGIDKKDLSGEGFEDAAVQVEIDEDFLQRTAFSVSNTGAKISNHLDYADWNHFQDGEVTYLSRSDWEATFPKSYSDLTLTNQELIDLLNGKYYTIKTDDDTSSIKWGQDSDLMFYEMYGSDYDDPRWSELLDKVTLEQAQYLTTFGGPSIPGIESIGTVETFLTENAGNGVAVNLNASKDPGAPWNISPDDINGNWHPEIFGSSPLTASTFNPDLCRELGEFIGEESLFTGAMLTTAATASTTVKTRS